MEVHDRVAPPRIEHRLAAGRALRVQAGLLVLQGAVEVTHEHGRAAEGLCVLEQALDLGEVLRVPALELPRVGRGAVEVRREVHAVDTGRGLAGLHVGVERPAPVQGGDVGEVQHAGVLEGHAAGEHQPVAAAVAEDASLAEWADHRPQGRRRALADLGHQGLGALWLVRLELGEDRLALLDDAVGQRVALEPAAGTREAGDELVLAEEVTSPASRSGRGLQLLVVGEVQLRVALGQGLDRRVAVLLAPDLLQADQVGLAALDGGPDLGGANLCVVDEAVSETDVPGLDVEDDVVLGEGEGQEPEHGTYQRLRMSM